MYIKAAVYGVVNGARTFGFRVCLLCHLFPVKNWLTGLL